MASRKRDFLSWIVGGLLYVLSTGPFCWWVFPHIADSKTVWLGLIIYWPILIACWLSPFIGDAFLGYVNFGWSLHLPHDVLEVVILSCMPLFLCWCGLSVYLLVRKVRRASGQRCI